MTKKIFLYIIIVSILAFSGYIYYKSSFKYEYEYHYFGGKVKFYGRYHNDDLMFSNVVISLADFDYNSGTPPKFFENKFKLFTKDRAISINKLKPDEIIQKSDQSIYYSNTESEFNGIKIREIDIHAEHKTYLPFILSVSFYENKPISIYYQINLLNTKLSLQEKSYCYFTSNNDSFGFPLKQKELITILGKPDRIIKKLLWP